MPKIFQFTPLREGRRKKWWDALDVERISIHAPPRGATFGRITTTFWTTYFNSRPSARGDLDGIRHLVQLILISIHAPPRGATPVGMAILPPKLFQFTPLREGRRNSLRGCVRPTSYFNSRPSARGDCRGRCSARAGGIFQFTPLREGRLIIRNLWIILWIFQFTPLREGRPKW